MMPAYYSLERYSNTQLEYELPQWMNKPIRPMIRQWLSGINVASRLDNSDAPISRWVYLQNYVIEPGPDGKMFLRLLDYVPSRDARVEYWFPNGRLGIHDYFFGDEVLGACLYPDSEFFTLRYPQNATEPIPHMPQHGLWVVDNEYVIHHGAFNKRNSDDNGTAQIYLYNLQRGMFGTPILPMVCEGDESIIEPAIFVDDTELITQLLDSVRSQMHALWMTRGHSQERQHHSQMMLYYKDKAESFWRTYRPARSTRMAINYDQPI